MRSAFVQIIAASAAGFVTLAAPYAVLAQTQWQVVPAPSAYDFPQQAMDEGLSGRATVRCNATSSGVIENCEILSETPEGYGFGQSAVRIVQRGQLVPSADGQPYRDYQITVPFTLETARPVEAKTKPVPRTGEKPSPKPRP